MTERGKGLISSILRHSEPRELKQPVHRLNPKALKTKSDREYADTFVKVAQKLQRKEPVTREEKRAFKSARRKLMDRGLLALVTHEDE